jgi:hypothetical protein
MYAIPGPRGKHPRILRPSDRRKSGRRFSTCGEAKPRVVLVQVENLHPLQDMHPLKTWAHFKTCTHFKT